MVKYRLVYFDFKGKGELARLVFAAANQSYEDKRIEYSSTSAEWSQFKPKTPFGKLPVLEMVDEETASTKTLAQSVTIGRYLGNIFGLGGKNDWEKADIDQYADQITDFSLKIIELLSQTDDSKLKDLTEEMWSTVLPTHLGFFQNKISKSEKNYLFGDRLTWVDLYLFNIIDWFDETFKQKLLNNYPIIKRHNESVLSNEGVSQWVAKRPVTKY